MIKQCLVIGLGQFGASVAVTLSSLGHEVLAVDILESKIQSVINTVTHVVQADAREEEALRAIGIKNFDLAVVSVGSDIESNILITVMLKEMGVKYVVSKAQNALHGKILEKVGADKIVYPEKDMGIRLAHNLTKANVMDYFELSLSHSVMEIKAPCSFTNMSLGELNIRAKYGISVMAIKKEKTILVAPGAGAVIEKDDSLIIIAENSALLKLPA